MLSEESTVYQIKSNQNESNYVTFYEIYFSYNLRIRLGKGEKDVRYFFKAWELFPLIVFFFQYHQYIIIRLPCKIWNLITLFIWCLLNCCIQSNYCSPVKGLNLASRTETNMPPEIHGKAAERKILTVC